MRKCDNYFAVSGYAYAPEQFKAFRVTGFSNGNKNVPVYEQIKLSNEDTHACGYELCCKGRAAAIAKLKSIVRNQERNKKQYCTFGFFEENNNRTYHFTRDLIANDNNLKDKLTIFKEFKQFMLERNCEVVIYTEAKLGSGYQVEEKREHKVKVDINRPCKVYFRNK